MKWVSEAEALPPIGQSVLLMVPRQAGEFWDLHAAGLAADYDGVAPHPVAPGSRWPVKFWWNISKRGREPVLVTGNAWWAEASDIPLPPGAEHRRGPRGDHYIAQPERVWVDQGK